MAIVFKRIVDEAFFHGVVTRKRNSFRDIAGFTLVLPAFLQEKPIEDHAERGDAGEFTCRAERARLRFSLVVPLAYSGCKFFVFRSGNRLLSLGLGRQSAKADEAGQDELGGRNKSAPG